MTTRLFIYALLPFFASSFTHTTPFFTKKDRRLNSNLHAQISLEYCPGCRWSLRSFWFAQELLTTFADDAALEAVTLIPSPESGRFRVTCDDVLLWDRKEQGGFPEIKQLKQLVRDEIDPSKFLGHSDTQERKEKDDVVEGEKPVEFGGPEEMKSVRIKAAIEPHVAITYCTGCRWLLRAAWYAQELVQTFEKELGSVSLIPSRPPVKGGVFVITLNDEIICNREETGFPQITELKQMVRDRVDPTKDLGHADVVAIDNLDDDEAEEARKFFGVF